MLKALQDFTTITVLGFGLTGVSCVRYLQSLGITPVVLDTRAAPPGLEQDPALAKASECYFGPLQLEHLLQSDLIIVSPGIDRRQPVIQMAIDAGIPMVSDIELFAWVVDVPVVGITGSNGKSTVTELTGHILRSCGMNPAVAGNIGVPVLDYLTTKESHDCFVLELSSFQLELIDSLKLHAATILNITSDHLDRYDDERAYERAKHRIYQHAKLCVWNRDDAKTMPLFKRRGMQQIAFGAGDAAKGFGVTRSGKRSYITWEDEPLLDVASLPIQGMHNVLNVQAALGLVKGLGIEPAVAAKGIQGFKALPHRCQLIAEHGGVRWIDDSKATNPGAAIAAIEGLRATVPGQLILIAGGDAKGADLSVLQPVLEQIDVLITLGRDGAKIAGLKQGARQVQTLNEAVAYAAKQTSEGSMVLLSPACASLDMFSNYKERGLKFKAAVEAYYAHN
ncbi:UDP-N-acetylmuramoyl-L-alanine--D-glutamate ligase [Aliidiomarina sanyensis]|uniref:UDP-N-acetylmuramoylalanine--D-glutamate ligase n=1 Tax=Aliidiomarina sanyensis TaxID=1249555 RepID=A0A432WI55_9GAMM|nr:UDP-N-acetylmuramoyl-L-alanine--D-glutamate ligase [Aliidiomarina sanyensis]RUO33484.1 UDP-N-acetylmuramoyl-L-alanine--D-glutamate ligase [Aliidiomarina sanyensis]